MTDKVLKVIHYNPVENKSEERKYCVPCQPGATVLQALQYIYAELDPTLAFRYGCRYKRCGLCGVMVDGKPRLACKVKLETVSEVAPLSGLPLLRSLVVDRSSYMKELESLELYPHHETVDPLGNLLQDPLHKNLMNCVECLCCVSSCPDYTYKEGSAAGPYTFVKLAQLHLDSRDNKNRTEQAKTLGADKCAECGKCHCPNGIHLHKAIDVLLDK